MLINSQLVHLPPDGIPAQAHYVYVLGVKKAVVLPLGLFSLEKSTARTFAVPFLDLVFVSLMRDKNF